MSIHLLGLGARSGKPRDLSSLFAGGVVGVNYDFTDKSKMFSDAGVTPVSAVGDLVYRTNDISGNSNYLQQTTSGRRWYYAEIPYGGRRNRFNYSEDLTHAVWVKSNVTIVANSDGVADKLYITNLTHNCYQLLYLAASAVYTYSVEFKAAGKNFAYLQVNDNGSLKASFVTVDLTNGAVGTPGALAGGGLGSPSAAVTDMGGGYYRLALTFTTDASGNEVAFYFAPCNQVNDRATTVDGTNGILVRNAMLESGSTATHYQTVTSNVSVTEVGVPQVGCIYNDGARIMSSLNPPLSSSVDNVTVGVVGWMFNSAAGLIAQTASTGSWETTTLSWGLLDAVTFNAFGIKGSAGTQYANSPTRRFMETHISINTGDISADSVYAYLNNVAGIQNTQDRGTGNWSATHKLFVGGSANFTNHVGGYLYGLVVLPGVADAAAREQINNWYKYLSGVY